MDLKQSTLYEIVESERNMVLGSEEMYKDFYKNALEANSLLLNFIKSIKNPANFIFFAFLSQIRKHHTLALFSAVRLHHVQTGMNLRQVLEASAWAAYAIEHTEQDKFFIKDPSGTASVPPRLKNACISWLNTNCKVKSDEIKNLKHQINSSTAHSDIRYTLQNFEMEFSSSPANFKFSFFDFCDEYKVKADLWIIANSAIGLLDLFYGLNQKYEVFELSDNFMEKFITIRDENITLKEQVMVSDRFLKAKKMAEESLNS